ncbi:hypothetical protein H072_3665 [Dactylellina haptotyla CBS 200.50]|uniref:Uncharacterized protein n=1 Tax=Dactylellina haptotyla (strain CBS 200.50) TaxID=1284197 RepID=S8AH52_DACHA|nr:hypothetical protein H072_3665 [Dactylellina haptotyla CBS 200.50]
MPSTTTLLLASVLQFSLSYSLALPQAATTTAPPSSTTSAYVDATGSSSSSVGNISFNTQIGIICGVVAIALIAIGVLFYGYRKYHQRLTRRRTQIKMDEMSANINARVQNARKSGMLKGNVIRVYEGKGSGDERTVTPVAEITVGSPVDQALSALEGGNPFKGPATGNTGSVPRVGIWPSGPR